MLKTASFLEFIQRVTLSDAIVKECQRHEHFTDQVILVNLKKRVLSFLDLG